MPEQLVLIPEEPSEAIVAPRLDKDTAAVSPPLGLFYLPEFLSTCESDVLTAHIDTGRWLTDIARRVQHYGFKYDYSNRRIDSDSVLDPLPPWLADIGHQISSAVPPEISDQINPEQPFDQAIVNEYEPGQGIAPHVDRDCFGPVIATVSLESDVNMDLQRRDIGVTHTQRLEQSSLLILSGEARSAWHHGIAKRKADDWHGRKIPRQRRVSITFRTVL